MDGKKIIAATIVAVFCFAAVAVAVNSEQSDAATKTYEIYVEVINDDAQLVTSNYVFFDSEPDNQKYCEAANAAFKKIGLNALALGVSDKGGIWVKYDGAGFNNCLYSNGKAWTSIESTDKDYINNTKVGLAVNYGYITTDIYDELSTSEQAKWEETGWGDPYAYKKILEAPGTLGTIAEYTVNLEIVQDDLVKTVSDKVKFKSENNAYAWADAFNAAVSGNSVFSKTFAAVGMGYISISYDNDYDTACYYKDGSKWASIDDTTKYPSYKELAFELKNGFISKEKYDALPSGEKKCWQESGMGSGYEYQRIPGASPGSDSDNTMLYVGIAIAVVVVLVVVVFFVIKKKNA